MEFGRPQEATDMFDVEEKFFRLHSFARKAWSGLNPEIDIIEKVIRCQLRLRMSASRIAQDLSVLLIAVATCRT